MEFLYETTGNTFQLDFPRWPKAVPPGTVRVYFRRQPRFQTALFLSNIKPLHVATFVLDNTANDTAGGAGFKLIQPAWPLINQVQTGWVLDAGGTRSSPLWDVTTVHPPGN